MKARPKSPDRRLRHSLALPYKRRAQSRPGPGARSFQDEVRRIALSVGIQSSYVAMGGEQQEASTETLQALLELWGLTARNPRSVADTLRDNELRFWRRGVEPFLVAWEGKKLIVELRLPAEIPPDAIHAMLYLEGGSVKAVDLPVRTEGTLRIAEIDGVRFSSRQLELGPLPLGYHELVIEARRRRHVSIVLCAPQRSYCRPGATRTWAAFLPMYAAHSRSSWGAGNLGDWERLTELIAGLGGHIMSTLPLMSAFLGKPLVEPSPYSPASRLFWNEFYLDIESMPGFSECRSAVRLVSSGSFQSELQRFREAAYIDYDSQMRSRRRVLELLSTAFFASGGNRSFSTFLEKQPLVTRYAAFRAAGESFGVPWHRWEQRLKWGRIEHGDYAVNAARYHQFVQWQMEQQMSGLLKRAQGRRMSLYLDLPVGVHPDGFDIWNDRDSFAFPASVGAPPDLFFTKGQNWGFAPPHPQRARDSAYRYFRDYIRFQMDHCGFLRIDHVMGLHRLYWIPPGFDATGGAYVRYPAEELQAILNLESHRHKTVLVGENLGTVPPEVTEAMRRNSVRQIFVVQYEQQADSKRAVRNPPEKCVASLNTHDMPLFAAHWHMTDLQDRVALGLVAPRDVVSEKKRRAKLNRALVAFLRRGGFLAPGADDSESVLHACLEWLASTDAEVVQVNLEDLWGEERPQNLPGTSVERPNWRRKSRVAIEQIVTAADLRSFLKRLTDIRSNVEARAATAPRPKAKSARP